MLATTQAPVSFRRLLTDFQNAGDYSGSYTLNRKADLSETSSQGSLFQRPGRLEACI